MKRVLSMIAILVMAFTLLLSSTGALFANGQSGTSLTASVTGTPAWEKTYNWTIDKSVSPDSWELTLDQPAGISTYTIRVTKDAGTDQALVSGKITVTNSGNVVTSGLAIFVDLLKRQNGSFTVVNSAAVDLGTRTSIQPGRSEIYDYSIAIPSPKVGDTYKISARVTILNHSGSIGTPKGPSPDTSAFTVPSPVLKNNSINVRDTNGSSWEFNKTDSVQYTRTFVYCYAGVYHNTAAIVQTGASSSASVTVSSLLPEPQSADIWYLNNIPNGMVPSELEMEKISNMQFGSVILEPGQTLTWLSDQSALVNVTFPAGLWTLSIRTTQDWSADINAVLGVWDITKSGEDKFTPLASAATISYDASTNRMTIIFDAYAITVMKENFLALRITNSSTVRSNDIITCWITGGSTLTPPEGSPGYPIPELSAGMLLGLGLLTLGAIIVLKRRKMIKIAG